MLCALSKSVIAIPAKKRNLLISAPREDRSPFYTHQTCSKLCDFMITIGHDISGIWC